MEVADFRLELDRAIQYGINVYRDNCQEIKDLNAKGANAPERLSCAVKAYQSWITDNKVGNICQLLILPVIFRMFGISYAVDSYIGRAVADRMPEIGQQRSYGVREESGYIKDVTALELQKKFQRHVMPAIESSLQKKKANIDTVGMINMFNKAATFVARSTKGTPLNLDDITEGGMSALDKEQLLASFDERIKATTVFSIEESDKGQLLEDE